MQLDISKNIAKLQKIFKIKINDTKNFEKALTHSSFTRENDLSYLECYERLEFLGDAVLKMCTSEILYKKYPEYAEGQMTKIRSIVVSDNTLAEIAIEIGLNKLMRLGKIEEKSGGRDKKSIMACTFEAVLGAYYLAGNFKEISKFLEANLTEMIENVDKNFEKFNAKAVLQEFTQSQTKKLPTYKIIEEKGPEHDKIFIVEVEYLNKTLAIGEGKTKREAEQEAAYNACTKLGAIKKEV